jgi:hypothetical protein
MQFFENDINKVVSAFYEAENYNGYIVDSYGRNASFVVVNWNPNPEYINLRDVKFMFSLLNELQLRIEGLYVADVNKCNVIFGYNGSHYLMDQTIEFGSDSHIFFSRINYPEDTRGFEKLEN